jgi:hypothetical protein
MATATPLRGPKGPGLVAIRVNQRFEWRIVPVLMRSYPPQRDPGGRSCNLAISQFAGSCPGSTRKGQAGHAAVCLLRGDPIFIAPEGLAQARLDVADIMKQVAWYKAQNLVEAGVDAAAMLDLSFVKGHFNAG